jgi:hypothetical protein
MIIPITTTKLIRQTYGSMRSDLTPALGSVVKDYP